MTDTVSEVKEPAKRARRTPEELKVHLLSLAAAIDAKREARHKADLLLIAEELKGISDARQDKALQGCVATIVGCANSIKSGIPQ